MIERMSKKHLLNRFDSVKYISLMIIFLIPEKSICINAQDFSVDGKMSRVIK